MNPNLGNAYFANAVKAATPGQLIIMLYDGLIRFATDARDALAEGRPVHCTAGHQIRPFIYIEDAARAIVALLFSGVEGAVNIALEEVASVQTVAMAAARYLGAPHSIHFGEQEMRRGEPDELRAAVDRLCREVGFQPRYSIAEGVRRTVNGRMLHHHHRPLPAACYTQ